MTPVEMMRNRLISDADVSALVGNRVYCDVAPQNTEFPFIVLTVENGTAEDCLDGPVGFFSDIVGYDIYSMGRIESLDVWKKGWSVLAGYTDSNAVTILDSVNQETSIAWDTYRLDDASDDLVYRCSQNLQVNYSYR